MTISEAYLRARNFVGRNKPNWMKCQALRAARIFVDNLFLDSSIKYGEKTEVLTFKRGVLRNQSLIFPHPADFINQTPFELKGYFALGNLIHPGNVVYDGGAWPGEFTVIASKLAGNDGRVYAFEPNPTHAKYLQRVIQLNGCTNVILVEKALSRISGRSNFHEEGASSRLRRDGSVKVETVSLDDFASSFGQPSFVKLDIEGEELSVIDGASKTIVSHHPTWAIASYHNYLNGGQTCEPLEKVLKRSYREVITTYPMHKTTFAFNH